MAVLLGHLDAAVEGDPAHRLRVDELFGTAAHLPDARIGPVPDVADVLDDVANGRPILVGDFPIGPRELVDGQDEFAVDTELKLVGRPVADAHGRRVPIAFEMVEFLFLVGRAVLETVDRLEVGRLDRVAEFEEPVEVVHRLLGVAEVPERPHGKGPVAYPVVPVVPVAHPADHLRERGRRRGGNPTSVLIGEQFEHEVRTHHHVVGVVGKRTVPVVGTGVCPVAPELDGVVE